MPRWKRTLAKVVKVCTVIVAISCITFPCARRDTVHQNNSDKSKPTLTGDENLSSRPIRRITDYWKGGHAFEGTSAVNSSLSLPTAKTLLGRKSQMTEFTTQKAIVTKPIYESTTSALFSTSTSPTSLEHIYLAVKTTRSNHDTRLKLQLSTWIPLAKQSTYVFTDAEDPEYKRRFGLGHFINTKCGSTHGRAHLVCKMSVEYDTFMTNNGNKRWFCSLDDDTYVNVPNLLKLLQTFDHTKDLYVGKRSLKRNSKRSLNNVTVEFHFGTGGAMWCITTALALKMAPYTLGRQMGVYAARMKIPDDMVIGFIICHFTKSNLTTSEYLHSHLEKLSGLSSDALKDQITLSYSGFISVNGSLMLKNNTTANVINATGIIPNIPVQEDPTRLLTLHSNLFSRL